MSAIFLRGNISEGFAAFGPYADKDAALEVHDTEEGWVMTLIGVHATRIDPARTRPAEREVTVTWETDGQTVDLPSTVRVPRNVDDEAVADWLSDKYDWLVLGWAEA